MSVSTPQKPSQRENPFLKVAAPPIRNGIHSQARPSAAQAAVPPPALKSRSATLQWKKRQNPLNWKTTASISAAAIVIFTLLPMPAQQQLFQRIGLGTVEGKTLLSVPLPVEYDYVSSPFGQRWGRRHQGIDLAANTGTPIYAASTGKVTHSGWESGYGNSVVIDHGQGRLTRYGHCSKVLIKAGARVQKGQLIAQVGSTGHSTGPHLHFEVIVNGIRKNPAWYYKFDKAPHWYALKVAQGKNWLQAFSEKLARWVKL